VAHPQIATFARLANADNTPQRLLAGQASKLGRTMHDIHYNPVRDEFYVGNPFAQAILTFRGGAQGEESPIRIIQGPKTRFQKPDVLEVDNVNGELYVPQGEEILVFPITGNGDVPPIRTLRGGTAGWTASGGSAVDPIHNVYVAAGNVRGAPRRGPGNRVTSLLIFDRLANGEVKPLRVIRGPKTGLNHIRQIEIQPEKGWIVVTDEFDGGIPEPEGTFIGVWSINDSGDVPPRWKIEGKPGNKMKKPHGIALDSKHKEIYIADMTLNAVLTFYFPEIF
jgi:DNA-binding beta-propeller fold protein YncE